LWIIRKVIAYLQPYFFYTNRCEQYERTFGNSGKLSALTNKEERYYQ
jgi:hypothetical protein